MIDEELSRRDEGFSGPPLPIFGRSIPDLAKAFDKFSRWAQGGCGESEQIMSTQDTSAQQEWHRKFAADTFNLVWDLLDKEERTAEEDDKMLHAAHASRFHWGEIGTPLEFERGEWQISRVYAVLGHPQPSIYHAQRCLAICKEHGIGDFDLAFAYEALARAYAVSGELEKSQEYIKLAEQAGEQIEEQENRTYFFSELRTVSGLLNT
jgi:hypothetical protein